MHRLIFDFCGLVLEVALHSKEPPADRHSRANNDNAAKPNDGP